MENRRSYQNKGGRMSFGRTTTVVAINMSHFDGVTIGPPEPILEVSEAFRADKDALKLNLAVRSYQTEELEPYVLDVVKRVSVFTGIPESFFLSYLVHNVISQNHLMAEKLMPEKGENMEYPPIEGLTAFNKITAELFLGTDHPVIQQQRVARVQSLSGTGSIRLASAFIQRYFLDAQAMISSPTWGST